MNWYMEVLKKYTDFTGRARRTEYWMFFLINLIIGCVLGFVEVLFGGPGVLGTIYSLAVLLPGIAVSVRRLHDTDRSGLWILIAFVPVIGFIALIYFYVQEGARAANQYGPDPKGSGA